MAPQPSNKTREAREDWLEDHGGADGAYGAMEDSMPDCDPETEMMCYDSVDPDCVDCTQPAYCMPLDHGCPPPSGLAGDFGGGQLFHLGGDCPQRAGAHHASST